MIPPATLDKILQLVVNMPIQAIKILQSDLGLSLVEAKKIVAELRSEIS